MFAGTHSHRTTKSINGKLTGRQATALTNSLASSSFLSFSLFVKEENIIQVTSYTALKFFRRLKLNLFPTQLLHT